MKQNVITILSLNLSKTEPSIFDLFSWTSKYKSASFKLIETKPSFTSESKRISLNHHALVIRDLSGQESSMYLWRKYYKNAYVFVFLLDDLQMSPTVLDVLKTLDELKILLFISKGEVQLDELKLQDYRYKHVCLDTRNGENQVREGLEWVVQEYEKMMAEKEEKKGSTQVV